jgi:hypothetical protein
MLNPPLAAQRHFIHDDKITEFNFMFVMLFWMCIHTRRAEIKVCLTTVGIEPATFEHVVKSGVDLDINTNTHKKSLVSFNFRFVAVFIWSRLQLWSKWHASKQKGCIDYCMYLDLLVTDNYFSAFCSHVTACRKRVHYISLTLYILITYC